MAEKANGPTPQGEGPNTVATAEDAEAIVPRKRRGSRLFSVLGSAASVAVDAALTIAIIETVDGE